MLLMFEETSESLVKFFIFVGRCSTPKESVNNDNAYVVLSGEFHTFSTHQNL